MSSVRVRYAPSPTGIPHIGNIRTALFNFLFAKNQNGRFILRIEDTDQNRLVAESIAKIKESLEALGLCWDEFCQQSDRLPLYNKCLDELKQKDWVWEDEGAWRFKVSRKSVKIDWDDVVHGHVEFASDVIEDFVIMKSDGFPTYHFASVVDDHDMKISHVLRGDEWISSTPKHLLLYEAFGWSPPLFVHLSPILGANKKKLSKREGARSVLEYIDEGYLPEAIVNFLALLGWAPKDDREIFSLDELSREFSLDRLNKNSPIFNIEKLKWFNGRWIRKLSQKEYTERMQAYWPKYDSNITTSVAYLTQDRVSTLAEYSKIADFFYNSPKFEDIPPVKISDGIISHVADAFYQSKSFGAAAIKDLIDQTAEQDKVDRVDLIAGIRNIISGSTVTPPLYESLEKLGREETLARLKDYVAKKKK